MIVPDANLLIYAYDSTAPQHDRARDWWENLMNGNEQIGLPWLVAVAFMRLTTHPTINRFPMAPQEVLSILKSWEGYLQFGYLHPGPRHREILGELFKNNQISGNRINDAHIAAIAMEHNGCVHSSDADFARFEGLRWVNPIR